MEKFLESYRVSSGTKSAATMRAMQMSLRRLEKIFDQGFDDWTIAMFKEVDEIVSKVNDGFSLSTSISTILAIRQYLKYKNAPEALQDKYTEVMNKKADERKHNNTNQSKTEDEAANWIDWIPLGQKIEALATNVMQKDTSFSKFRNVLLLALYGLQPPVRIGNYEAMEYRDGGKMKRAGKSLPKTKNYIIHEGPGKYQMIFNVYKTAKSVGQQVHDVSNPTLSKMLDMWFDKYNKERKYLLVNLDGKPMSQTGITNAMKGESKRLLSKELTANSFRHIFLTWFLSTNPSIKQKEVILPLIGHAYTPSTAEKYVRR
jgi:site-specific recombinase XerD